MTLNPELKTGSKPPSLWVEKVGIFSAPKPDKLIREISLRRGVNVIWAKEPSTTTQTDGSRIVGHGVGKTSFCLLLRYCLGDTGTLVGNLRAELKQHFKYGGIAAVIHVNNQPYAVFRYFGENKDIYTKTDNFNSLLLDDNPLPYAEFETLLEQRILTNLSAKKIPETGQKIEWTHLLAWLTRDQGSRFASFFKWRAGEGIRLQRPALDPPIVMRAVLGLLETEEQELLKSIHQEKRTLQQTRDKITQQSQKADEIRRRIESDLRQWLGTASNLNLHSDDLFKPSVYQLLEDSNTPYAAKLAERETALQQFEERLQPLRTKLHLTNQAFAYWSNELQLLQAQRIGNEQEVRKLQKERTTLTYLTGECSYANIPFQQCTHIQHKQTTTRLSDQQEIRSLKNNITQQTDTERQALAQRDHAQQELQAAKAELAVHDTDLRRLKMARDTALIEARRGNLLKQELERWQNSYGTPEADQIIAKTNESIKDQEASIRAKETRLTVIQSEKNSRTSQLAHMTDNVARYLLHDLQGTFSAHEEDYPFRVITGSGEAHKVLDVLMGDLVCLLDATLHDSAFPAFLVHDCPREADMSQWLYERYLQLFLELDAAAGTEPPFQYIITTTSEPPSGLQTEPYLRLELSPKTEDHLLFRRYLTVQKDLYST